MQVSTAIAASLGAALISAGVAAVSGASPLARPAPAEASPGAPSASSEAPAGPASGAEAMRAARLDTLFAELADPANDHWRRAEAQIHALWNESGSPSMDLLARRAEAAIQAEDLDMALSFLNDLVRLAPDYAEGWNKRATVHFMRGEYGRALSDIARTLALAPRHFGAYAGLGIILDRLGKEKEALEAYRRAIEIHPHLPGAAEGITELTREVEGNRI